MKTKYLTKKLSKAGIIFSVVFMMLTMISGIALAQCPLPTYDGSKIVCVGDVTTYVVTNPVAGATYNWQISSFYGVILSSGLLPSPDNRPYVSVRWDHPASGSQAWVRASYTTSGPGGCNIVGAQYFVTVNPLPQSYQFQYEFNNFIGDNSTNAYYCHESTGVTLSVMGSDNTVPFTTYELRRVSDDYIFTTIAGTGSKITFTNVTVEHHTLDAASSTEYYVVAYNPQLCRTSMIGTVTVHKFAKVIPGVIATTTPSNIGTCENIAPVFTSTTPASGGYEGFDYQWQINIDGGGWNDIPGATSTTYTHSTLIVPGTYEFRREVVNQCATVYSNIISITVNPLPTADAGKDAQIGDCPGQLYKLDGTGSVGATSLTYSWSPATFLDDPSIATPTFSGAPAGSYTYTLTVKDDYGCTATDVVTITVIEGPTVEFTPVNNIDLCIDTDYTLEPVITAGTSLIYSWTGTGMSYLDNTGVESPTFIATATGTFSLILTVTDQAGCKASDTFTIKVHDKPLVDAGEDQEVCGLQAGLVGTVTTTIASPTYTWTVDGPGTVTFTAENDLITDVEVSAYGKYEFMLSVQALNCGVVTDVVTVEFFDTPTINPEAVEAVVCGKIANLKGNVDNFYGTPVYEWEKVAGPGTVTFTASTAEDTGVEVSVFGTYTFTLKVTNAPCGTVSDVVTVSFYGTPEVYCPDNEISCETDGTVIIYDIGGYTLPDGFGTATESYTSTTGVVTYDGNEITFEGGVGQHVITYWVENGPCVNSCTFTIFIYPEYEGEIKGDEIVFSGTKTVTYSIDPQDITETLFVDGYWTTVGDVDVDMPKITFNNVNIVSGAEAEIEIGCPGFACFDWEIIGDGEIILKYEIGGVETDIYSGSVVGTKTGTLCELYIDDDFAFVGYTVSGTFTVNITNFKFETESLVQWYLDVENGDPAVHVIGPDDDYAIDIEVAWPFVGTYTLTVEVTSCAGCVWSDTKTVTVKPNQLVGQLKYYNEAEGPMPSPFDITLPSFSLPVHGHFIVALLDISDYDDIEEFVDDVEENGFNVIDDLIVEFKPVMEYYKDEDPGKLHYHPLLTKDEYYEAAFGFEENLDPEGTYVVIVFESYFNEDVHEFDTYFDNIYTWTWNNWPGAWVGGVNATDALLIQHMTAHSLNGSGPQLPFRSAHPYNPFDAKIADANNNGGITSLDALLAQRRGMGLIPQFLNGALNFTVGGIFVDKADFNTNNIFGKGKFPELYKNLNDYFGNPYYIGYDNSIDYLYISSLFEKMSGEKYLNIYYNAVGDINSSFYPVYGGFKDAGITLSTEGELVANIGDVVDIPVSMNDFAELGAITLGLNFDNSLIEVLGTNYDEESAYFSNEDGQIVVMWADRNGVTFDKGQPILTIKARILGNITPDTELLSLNEYTELANVQADIVYNDLKTIGLNTTLRASALTATNYPNPLTNRTTISYNLPEAGVVKIVLYDKLGQEVATLLNAYENSGSQTYDFNQELAPGVYHYRITLFGENGDYTVTRSMIVVR
ncbi:MAG: T9SS type A sorting domain-containing protein [Bacteroidales bacterium]